MNTLTRSDRHLIAVIVLGVTVMLCGWALARNGFFSQPNTVQTVEVPRP